jgi:hypothetical protein
VRVDAVEALVVATLDCRFPGTGRSGRTCVDGPLSPPGYEQTSTGAGGRWRVLKITDGVTRHMAPKHLKKPRPAPVRRRAIRSPSQN